MTTLSVIVDPIVSPATGGIGRYTEELTRALIDVAPSGCNVSGFASATSAANLELLNTLLPGIAGITTGRLGHDAQSIAWRYGFGRITGRGMVHATSLFAPLSKHDRLNSEGDQIAVTIHDVVPWTHPQTLDPRRVAWRKAMASRAHRFADAIIVPTHSVATELGEIMDFGDRIRVISPAVSSKLQLPIDADARAARLALPEEYVLSVGTVEPRKGLEALIRSFAEPGATGLPLLIAGPAGWGDLDVSALAEEAGLAEGRVRMLGFLADADLAVALDRATVFAFPSIADGFGLPVIEAFHFGTPVVHSDTPAVVEVAAGAGVAVEREDAAGYPARLAEAIAGVAGDPALAQRLSFSGRDRSSAFSWRDSAEKIWQLHADL